MDMTDGEMILTALGSQTVVLGVLGFVGRALGKHWLDKDLKEFELKLKASADEKITALAHDLEKAKLEHQVRFSKLHERRAEVISQVYELLTDFYGSSQVFTSVVSYGGDPPREEKYKKALEDGAKLYLYFDRNRIWLPASVCEQIEKFVRDMRIAVDRLGVYLPYLGKDGEVTPPHIFKQHLDAWQGASESFRDEIPKARGLLEAELRQILGDAPSVPGHLNQDPSSGEPGA
jgi:hypothetical protein